MASLIERKHMNKLKDWFDDFDDNDRTYLYLMFLTMFVLPFIVAFLCFIWGYSSK